MKRITIIAALLLLGAGGVGTAWADRGHVRFGITIGPYWGGPWHYPPPVYYYPPYYAPYYAPVVVQPPAPQVYIEQPQVPAAPPAPIAAAPVSYWYYCAAAKGYYPYVRECPSGWQRVLPRPQGQP
jgi:hypothetical protein